MKSTALCCLALLAGLARAQTGDLDVRGAYRLDVLLDISKHRLLTDDFKEQVRRELEEGLQAAYGELARVKVYDRPQLVKDAKDGEDRARAAMLIKRLDEVRKVGLQKPLDDWREIQKDGVKTHFVLIDFDGDQYEVQARQHDGHTGQASPVVRKEQTADRSFVSRLATILVDRDFGIVGMVPPGASGTAAIQLKGAGRGSDLGRWVKKGDVFIIVPIPRAVSQTMPALNAVLQVTEPPDVAGRCQCRILDRFEATSAALKKPAASFRCLKIHTIKGPMRIRVMQEPKPGDPPQPGGNLKLTLRRQGFSGEELTALRGDTDTDGLFGTERKAMEGVFDRLVFVELKLAGGVSKVPVPIIDDRPALIRVAPQVQDEGRLLAVRKDLWESAAYDAGVAMQQLFLELKDLELKPNEQAKAVLRAKQGLEGMRAAKTELNTERAAVAKQANDRGDKKIDFTIGDAWLRYLDNGIPKLEAYLKEKEDNEKEEKNPKRLRYLALVQQGKLDEERAEFQKALEAYREAARTEYADANLKKHLGQLEELWKSKGPMHDMARSVIYTTFPAANLAKEPNALKEAEAAFKVCQDAGDVLAPQKLLQEILAHAGKLKAIEKGLQDFNEEDRALAKTIIELAEKLKKLGLEVDAYLKQNAK